ncbi:MAG TPA: glycosyltransferase family 4 protein, partial [Longimicrobium sp.]|nr:glycosyltransferase family 4 protein [Longimicrobium sp.]
ANVLDIPGHRSSHTVPTPRGGGLAIVLVFLAGTALAGLAGWVQWRTAVALAGGGAVIALVGWIDDHGGLAARWRALAHFAAAGWAVFWLDGLPTLDLGTATARVGLVGAAIAVLGIVWVTNLYNFMDGIDGIAGGQALVAGVAGGALLWADGRSGLAGLAWLLAAASAGFLAWNWSPAKIFMGDVGSGVLGFTFAALAVASERAGSLPLMGWVLLLGVFVFDATVTLARRVLRGESFHQAHRSHAYQRVTQAGWTHARTSGAVIAVALLLSLLAGVGWARPALLLPAFVAGAAFLAVLYLAVERARPMYPSPQRRPSEG